LILKTCRLLLINLAQLGANKKLFSFDNRFFAELSHLFMKGKTVGEMNQPLNPKNSETDGIPPPVSTNNKEKDNDL